MHGHMLPSADSAHAHLHATLMAMYSGSYHCTYSGTSNGTADLSIVNGAVSGTGAATGATTMFDVHGVVGSDGSASWNAGAGGTAGGASWTGSFSRDGVGSGTWTQLPSDSGQWSCTKK